MTKKNFVGFLLAIGFLACNPAQAMEFRPFLSFGGGLEDVKMGNAYSSSGDTKSVTISAGGGIGLGIDFREKIENDYAVDFGVSYHFTSEKPEVKDFDASFKYYRLALSGLKDFKLEHRGKIYAGAGGTYHLSPQLSTSGALDIESDYKNSFGYQLFVGWEPRDESQKFRSAFELRYTGVTYKAQSHKLYGAPTSDIIIDGTSLSTLDGSAIDLRVVFVF